MGPKGGNSSGVICADEGKGPASSSRSVTGELSGATDRHSDG